MGQYCGVLSDVKTQNPKFRNLKSFLYGAFCDIRGSHYRVKITSSKCVQPFLKFTLGIVIFSP